MRVTGYGATTTQNVAPAIAAKGVTTTVLTEIAPSAGVESARV